MDIEKPIACLPTPFTAHDLWVVSLQDTQTQAVMDRLILADAGQEGLDAIKTRLQGQGIELMLAMSREHLRRLQSQLAHHEATQGALPGTPQEREWPTWAASPKASFVVTWISPSGMTKSTWVSTQTAGEALLSVHQQHPEATLVGVGSMAALEQQMEDLGGCVSRQDFGQVGWDFRTRVQQPATAAHIDGYNQAKRGLFSTPEEGMLRVQQLYLEDLMDEEEYAHG